MINTKVNNTSTVLGTASIPG